MYIQKDNNVCGEAYHYRQGNGQQYAKIGKKCMTMRTILHELGHSNCLAHEHNREDRNDFVKLTDKANISDHNYQVVDSSKYTTLGLLYDYESVMHYGCPYRFKAKSAGVKDCGTGQKLSVLDVEKINSLYNCGGNASCFMNNSRRVLHLKLYFISTRLPFISIPSG